jgi:hypothetical protein
MNPVSFFLKGQNMRNLARNVGVLLALPILSAAVVRADTLAYKFLATGTPYGEITATMPASPTPASFTATSFELSSIPVVVDGDPVTENIDFYTSAAGGGAAGAGVHVDGDQLFTGLTSSPTFKLGTFTVGGFDLTISQAASAVPEPASLFLFGTGALIAYGVFKRKLDSASPDA